GRRHQDARQVVPVAGNPRDGDVPPVVPAAALQSGRQARGLGRTPEGAALRVRLGGASGSRTVSPRLPAECPETGSCGYCPGFGSGFGSDLGLEETREGNQGNLRETRDSIRNSQFPVPSGSGVV